MSSKIMQSNHFVVCFQGRVDSHLKWKAASNNL